MKLVYKETGQPVKVGDEVIIRKSSEIVHVDFFREPTKPSSEGKISVRDMNGHTNEYYVGVIGAEWIEREDRGWVDLSKFLKPGSISSGTMRSRHLIPAFLSALESVDTEAASKLREDYAGIFEMLENGEDPETGPLAEECNDLVNESLFNALGELCPPFHSFGSHEGDRADFGVWFCRESFEDAVREGSVMKVDAGTAWENDDRGDANYVAVVTDHGNITLFSSESKQELWSIV